MENTAMKLIDKLVNKLLAALDKWLEKHTEKGLDSPSPAESVATPPSTENPGPDLVWDCGGVDGSKSIETEKAQIASLRVTNDGLSYKWTVGGCEVFGAADRGDASRALACAFYLHSDGRLHGGKFDWISTSRTTRSFENIRAGYHGWPTDAHPIAFCILSSDRKLRTNVIEI